MRSKIKKKEKKKIIKYPIIDDLKDLLSIILAISLIITSTFFFNYAICSFNVKEPKIEEYSNQDTIAQDTINQDSESQEVQVDMPDVFINGEALTDETTDANKKEYTINPMANKLKVIVIIDIITLVLYIIFLILDIILNKKGKKENKKSKKSNNKEKKLKEISDEDKK